MQEFLADIIKDTAGRITFIKLPFNAKEVFHKDKGTLYVSGMINNIPYRSKLLSRGGGQYIMVLDKPLQKLIGFEKETVTVHITMSLDEITVQYDDAIPQFAECGMDVITAIKTRKSIRQFTKKPLSKELLHTILYAGMCAPTAKNKRPYHFIIIEDKVVLNELSQSNPNAEMLAKAACAVVVCGDRNMEGIKEFLYADCAAAVQNMLLCVQGLKLGGVWCGVAANSAWQKLLIIILKLPIKIDPIAVIALGYPAEEKEMSEKWEPKKIHYENW